MALKDSRIADLVDQNNVRAYVLYYFGIRFYEYSEQTLDQVCFEKGLRVENVVRELESPGENFQEADLPLISFPIDLIIEYLKHAHFLFVKHRLPYILRLVESFKACHGDYNGVEKDLKVLLPLFVEDFIHHIYEEEDTLFTYIKMLERALHASCNWSELYYKMEHHSLDRFSMEHEEHDDEMDGIRRITRNYYLSKDAPLHVKVIYSELRQFEKNLKTHARIENEILFPKALALESQVRQVLMEKVKYN
jgi:regulator of cell morphogenesis and NO signaling